MANIFSKLVFIILSVVVMFIYPTYMIYKHQDNLMEQQVIEATKDFVDNVRMKGYITPKMYEDYQMKIGIGPYLFEVEMQHEQKVYTPIYTDPSDITTFTGNYQVDYDAYYWKQIQELLFKEGDTTPKNQRMYKLQYGDTFSLTVQNKMKTKSTMLFDFLTGGPNGSEVVIYYEYGGMVLNEDY